MHWQIEVSIMQNDAFAKNDPQHICRYMSEKIPFVLTTVVDEFLQLSLASFLYVPTYIIVTHNLN